jgi:hypothetical protein
MKAMMSSQAIKHLIVDRHAEHVLDFSIRKAQSADSPGPRKKSLVQQRPEL